MTKTTPHICRIGFRSVDHSLTVVSRSSRFSRNTFISFETSLTREVSRSSSNCCADNRTRRITSRRRMPGRRMIYDHGLCEF